MPVFVYHIEKEGRLVKNKISAKTLQLAQLKLSARKIDPVFIKQQGLIPFFSGGGRVNPASILFFTRQLSFLLSAGVSLLQSLHMCTETTSDPQFKGVLRRIIRQLEAGKSFSQCLRSYPGTFDGFYVNMIVCSEETGLLDQILGDLANYMEKAEMVKSRVKSAMMYPIVVLAISFCIIIGIILFVVPQFEALYSGSGGLPALTQSLVTLSDLMRNNPLLLLLIFLGGPIALSMYSKTEGGRIQLRYLIRVLPLFGKIQYQAAMVRFFRSFQSLLKSGVNFLESLDVAYNIADHPDIQKGIKHAKEYVIKGKSFSQGLKDSKAFPPLVYNMARIGEESGKMEQSFSKLTSYYEELLDNLIAGLIKMIEPILIVFLGGIIGFMILALYLPVFNMGQVVN